MEGIGAWGTSTLPREIDRDAILANSSDGNEQPKRDGERNQKSLKHILSPFWVFKDLLTLVKSWVQVYQDGIFCKPPSLASITDMSPLSSFDRASELFPLTRSN